MSANKPMGVTVSPLLLRLALATTFIWTGMGKFFAEVPVQGESAAILANMGLKLRPNSPTAPAPNAPTQPLPGPEGTGEPAPEPEPAPPGDAKPPEPSGEAPKGRAEAPSRWLVLPAAALALGSGGQDQPPTEAATTTPGGATSPAALPNKTYIAADFPEPVKVKRLYEIALLLHAASNPPRSEGGTRLMALWPEKIAKGDWPLIWSWAVGLTELVGGVMILLGMFTRLWALGLAGVMVGAAWLTEIGPAVQAGKALLGFLPAHDTWDIGAWMHPMWQMALLSMALAVFFSGPGVLALDNAMFGRSPSVGDDEA